MGTRVLIWVEGERKTSYLFLDLLDKLRHRYPDAAGLHLILDNYKIHKSDMVAAALRLLGWQGAVALPASLLPG